MDQGQEIHQDRAVENMDRRFVSPVSMQNLNMIIEQVSVNFLLMNKTKT
jgi:hypothetical protein